MKRVIDILVILKLDFKNGFNGSTFFNINQKENPIFCHLKYKSQSNHILLPSNHYHHKIGLSMSLYWSVNTAWDRLISLMKTLLSKS